MLWSRREFDLPVTLGLAAVSKASMPAHVLVRYANHVLYWYRYASEAEMKRYNDKPFHVEISRKVRDEGLTTAVDCKQMELVMGTGSVKLSP